MAVNLDGTDAIDRALSLLAVTLESRGVAPVELVVIGGAALNVLGVCIRPTKDVDVLAVLDDRVGHGELVLVKQKPLPEPIQAAAQTVADALGLDPGWLNAGPADLLDCGLPEGFEGRLTPRRYGAHLTIHLPARSDLICLKVYAAADMGVGRHTEDLRALDPTCGELLSGVRWARTQDPSEGFLDMLQSMLRYFGCDDAGETLRHER